MSLAADDLTTRKAELKQQIARHCLIRSEQERLVNSRGEEQAWMFDLRPALLDGSSAVIIAELFWAEMMRYWPFQVAAQELAGVPLLAAVLTVGAQRGYAATGVIVRKERKQHGRQRSIEGDLSDLPIILVDDVVNSGGSVERTVAVLAALGGQVSHLFTVLDFGSAAASRKLGRLGLRGVSLFALSDFGLVSGGSRPEAVSPPPLSIRWRFAPKTLTYSYVARKAAVVVQDSRVYHATEAGWLHVLDAITGELVWEAQLAHHHKGIWSTPLVHQGAVYVGSYDGAAYKLDQATGAVIWRYEGADWIGSSPCLNGVGDLVYFGLEYGLGETKGAIVALSSATGEPVWRFAAQGQVHASPIFIGSGHVACGANDGRMRCLMARSGEPVWDVDLGGDIKSRAVLGRRGRRLFIGSCSGAVYALDVLSGDVVWRFDVPGPVYSIPLLLGDYLYITCTDGFVYKLGAERGRLLAKRKIGGKLFASPVLDGDVLLVGSTNGGFARLSLDTLDIQSIHSFDERITSEAAVDAAGVYIASFDGQLYAVDPI